MTKRLFLVTVLIWISMLFVPQSIYAAQTAVSGHKIVVDAGHGGGDGGSTACESLPEKTVNLQIANNLKTLIEADGGYVVMTRTDDSTLSNNDRYTKANSEGGEVLVSVHLNGSTNTATDGTLGLYGKSNKDLAFTKVIHDALCQVPVSLNTDCTVRFNLNLTGEVFKEVCIRSWL